jgi:hypothetical protein
MWKWSPKTPHTQFLCRVQFHKLPLKTHRDVDLATILGAEKFKHFETKRLTSLVRFI